VLRYSPDVVVFYAGDNDTSAGKSSEQIFEDLRDFAEGVMHSNSTTQVVFISVKPSLSRWTVWPQMVATNTLLRAYADKHANVHYADVATPMLGVDGEPIPELFVRDGLHMTEAGYDIWTRVVGDLLARLH
jgi:lysophospholipase L1-like esterase